jgi:signal peptidase I
MSLAFLFGIAAAALVESFFLGTLLLYLTSRWWKTTEISLKRAVALCAALMFGPVPAGLLGLAYFQDKTPSDSQPVVAVLLLLAMVSLPWYLAKRILRTGWWRALGVWLSTWVPLTLVNMTLAMVTRYIFAEAFVVPTGAMAPTVIGAHADRVCTNCGCEFNVSLSNWIPRADFEADRRPITTKCPNCRTEHVVKTNATPLPGDRILVDKTGLSDRWSVVVFRSPPNRKENYVKRLVGLSGETIELAGGEVFINGKLLRKEPHLATDLWFPLNDTALVPKNITDQTPHLRPRDEKSGWNRTEGQWTVRPGDHVQDVLEFVGNITDFVAYNDHTHENSNTEYPVGDVMVTCEIGKLDAPGTLGFEWEFARSTVRAQTQSDGQVVIEARAHSAADDVDRSRATGQLDSPLAGGDSLSFAIRDGQAYVLHNGRLAALAMFGPEDVELWRIVAPSDSGCKIAIVADDCSVVINRVTIHRDVYYIGSDIGFHPFHAGTGSPFELADGECFMLGDNSARLSDSRFFGGVPMADLIGVVRWIYWPSSRWHELR